MNQPDARTEIFRTAWSLYDSIIERNYMFHREIHARIRDTLGGRTNPGGYAMLDLGCGNARLLADTLRVFPPAWYLGVDLSGAALAEAAMQLRPLPAVELREQDMLACVTGSDPATYDVIYSSFALHHLTTADKGRLFGAAALLLRSGGELLLVDVVREEDQSREVYLDGYLRVMRTEWTAIPPAKVEEACAHVAAYDFPETFSTLRQLASDAGLNRAQVLDRFGPHYVLSFRS
jgi:SAM-dependent methyltransferase